MTPQDIAEKLTRLLHSPAGRDAGFTAADPIKGEPNVIGVELDDELVFITVQVA